MKRLLLVSNRLPITVDKRKGNFNFRQSVGGLATGLNSFYHSYNSIWIGWCGLPSNNIDSQEKQKIESILKKQYNSHSVFLSKKDIKMFYSGFCNKTIWPLFHYFLNYTVYDNDSWQSYKHVNKIFSQNILEIAKPNDTIWIHDYQLMLVPQMIRNKLPKAQIGFFLHIPFPSYELFRLLPWRNEILEGILGSDLIGFHTYDYVRHFMSSVRRILGHESTYSQFSFNNRLVKVDAFPMGIDFDRFTNAKHNNDWINEINCNCNLDNGCKVILSVDRLDYTKGILQRLEAFDFFLTNYPEYKRKVTMIQVAVPSRTGVETYKLLKQQVDQYIGRINGKHGTIGWMPVWYLYRSLPIERLTTLYKIADIALVTPLRDGMNLIAKEYIATKHDNKGVLLISEMAGAMSELSEAIIVNPNNKQNVADSLKQALLMPDEEQIERNKIMRNRLQRYNVDTWARDFMDRLSFTKNSNHDIGIKKLTNHTQQRLIEKFNKGSHRLLFLDYDGTLVPFNNNPQLAKPDDKLIDILKTLIKDPRNEIVIISGRDKNTLESWFDHLKINLSAEHGICVKEKNKTWILLAPVKNDWKSQVRPMIELYVDRTPGSFIEEKSYSLVWHFRKVDIELGQLRARELKEALLDLTSNLNLVVTEGSKVIEIKTGGVNKGLAASHWIPDKSWDFMLAVGDDWTDEDLFAVMPEWAYTIKVGKEMSKAKFFLDNYMEVRKLLNKLI
jgi:trehalose 6-phosphate synthase/phosphatase